MFAMSVLSTAKRLIFYLWLAALLVVVGCLVFNPSSLSADNLNRFFHRFEDHLLVAYIFFSFVRGIFLLPSTPFVLVGAMLFPDDPLLVIAISVAAVSFSATFLYYWSDLLGLSEVLLKKYPEKLRTVEYHLNKPYSILIIVFWSFFPLVPTDLICYVARVMRMRYVFMMLGILLGEIPLIALCVYFGGSLF